MNRLDWWKPKRNAGQRLCDSVRENSNLLHISRVAYICILQPNKCVTSVQRSPPEEPVPVNGVFDRAHPRLADEICQEKSLTSARYRGEKICQDVPKRKDGEKELRADTN